MFIYKDFQLVNLGNTFSVKTGGMAGRFVTVKGDTNNAAEYCFENSDQAKQALDVIVEALSRGKDVLYLDLAVAADRELRAVSLRQPPPAKTTARKPK